MMFCYKSLKSLFAIFTKGDDTGGQEELNERIPLHDFFSSSKVLHVISLTDANSV